MGSQFSDPLNRRDRTNSLTDRRHAFNVNTVWSPEFQARAGWLRYLLNNQRLAVVCNAQTGENFNQGGNQNLNGDATAGAAYQRPLYVGRNTILAQPTYESNLRYTRTLPITERWRPEFFFEFTNLFNHTNVTGLNTTTAVDTAGAILTAPSLAWSSALDPRLIQLGVRLSF